MGSKMCNDPKMFNFDRTNKVLKGCFELGCESVSIPEKIQGVEVKEIGTGAFLESGLVNVDLPEGLEAIRPVAFRKNNISSLSLPKTLKVIGNNAFEKNDLAILKIPSRVRVIESMSFARNTGLVQVEFSDSVEDIQASAFWGCNLMSVLIGENVDIDEDENTMGMNYGFKQFYEKQDKQSGWYTWVDGFWKLEEAGELVKSDKLDKGVSDNEVLENVVQGRKDMIQEYKKLLENTGYLVLTNKNSTARVEMGRTLENKVKALLVECVESLEEGLDEILKDAEGVKDTQLKETVCKGPKDFIFTKKGGVIEGSPNLDTTDIRIPKTIYGVEVERLGFKSFEDGGVHHLELPEGLKTIAYGALRNNYLCALELPSTIIKIGCNAFENNKLVEVKIPRGVDAIEDESFAGNRKLSRVLLPDSVNSIRTLAFSGCDLREIELGSEVYIYKDKGTMGVNSGFRDFYEAQGKKAGRYVWKNGCWEKAN